jgi:hypothetical protein
VLLPYNPEKDRFFFKNIGTIDLKCWLSKDSSFPSAAVDGLLFVVYSLLFVCLFRNSEIKYNFFAILDFFY